MVMKPDFTAERAMFKPNKANVTAYMDSIAPLNTFSDTFFSIIV